MACIAGCAIEPDAVGPHFQSVARLRTLYEKRPRQRIAVRYRPPHSRVRRREGMLVQRVRALIDEDDVAIGLQIAEQLAAQTREKNNL